MPRGDRTGPIGFGPMTGRGAGYCAGSNMPGYMNPGPGRGSWGRGYCGRGGGPGWRHWFYATGLPGWMRFGWGIPSCGVPPAPYVAPLSPEAADEAEVQAMKVQVSYLEQYLEPLRRRIQKLEGEAKAE